MSSTFSSGAARARGATLGAVVGAGAIVAGLVIAGALWGSVDHMILVGRSDDFYVATALWVAGLAGVGAMSGAAAGWTWGPRVADPSGGRRLGMAVRIAATATVIGASVISLGATSITVLEVALRSDPGILLAFPLLVVVMAVAGLALVGWLVLLAAIPPTFIWLQLMRGRTTEEEPF